VYSRGRPEAIKIAEEGDPRGYFLLQRSANNAPRHYDISPQPFWTSRTMTDPEHRGNRRTAIAGLAIAVALLVLGLWLSHELTASSKMQDCLMSGRTNCNVIDAPTR